MLRSLVNQIEYYVAAEKLRMAGRRLLEQWKYRADQPRVPPGSPEGGQWTFDPNAASHKPANAAPPRPPSRPATAPDARRRATNADEADVKVASPWDEINRPKCEAQYDSDMFQCKFAVSYRYRRSCEDHAMSRYTLCMKGEPIPPHIYYLGEENDHRVA